MKLKRESLLLATMALALSMPLAGAEEAGKSETKKEPTSQQELPSWMRKFSIGAQLKRQGRYKEAEPFLVQAAKEAEAANISPDQLFPVFSLLGGEYRYLARYEESIEAYKKALSICEKAKGKTTAWYATMLDNLAQVYSEKGDFQEAAALQEGAIRVYEKVLEPNEPDLGIVMINYAETLTHLNRLEEAEATYMKGIEIYKTCLPADDVHLAFAYDNLAALYGKTGKQNEAEEMTRKALAIFKKKLGPVHPDVTICISNLAARLLLDGKEADAMKCMEEHMSVLQKQGDPDELSKFKQLYTRMQNAIQEKKGKRSEKK